MARMANIHRNLVNLFLGLKATPSKMEIMSSFSAKMSGWRIGMMTKFVIMHSLYPHVRLMPNISPQQSGFGHITQM